MNIENQLLRGIDAWLRERGYDSTLNITFSYSRKSLASVPNITLWLRKVVLKLCEDQMIVWHLKSFVAMHKHVLDLKDPDVLDKLSALLDQYAIVNKDESNTDASNDTWLG